ncbi:MAG: hypothetical protein HF973_12450 [Chloroflexi bacterium]|nr:hypothetical protein [Chloroflexota bacterium]
MRQQILKLNKKVSLPTLIVAIVCLLYITTVLHKNDYDPLQFVIYDGHYSLQIGYRLFGEEAHIPPAYPYPDDIPSAYRWQRILYPLAARLLALNYPELLPWTLIVLNFAAIMLGTFVTELLLRHHRVSIWYALIYGLYAGNLVALRSDMNEPLSQMFVMLAILAWVRQKHRWSFIWFALAILSKETALLFVAAYGLYSLQKRNWHDVLGLGATAIPYVVWQIFLYSWTGTTGVSSGQPFIWLPFGGWLMSARISMPGFILISLLIIPIAVVPVIGGFIISIRALLHRFFHPYVYAILFNAIFILFLPHLTFRESSAMIRVVQGLALSILLFGAMTQSQRILRYSVLWLFANVIVISGTG